MNPIEYRRLVAEYRKLLTTSVKNALKETHHIHKDSGVGLLFSGGVDSALVLFSLLSLGVKPNCYTFVVDGYSSKDVDTSIKMCKHFGVNLEIIRINSNVDQLVKDTLFIIDKFKTGRQITIQCMHPLIYTIPQVKEKVLFNGLNADGLYGASRRCAVDGKDNQEVFNQLRWEYMFGKDLSDFYIKNYIEEHGIVSVDPYRCEDIIKFFKPLTYNDIHSPREKALAYESFKDYFDSADFKMFRRGKNYQIESKVRDFHELLLSHEINTKERKATMWLYKDLYEQMFGEKYEIPKGLVRPQEY